METALDKKTAVESRRKKKPKKVTVAKKRRGTSAALATVPSHRRSPPLSSLPPFFVLPCADMAATWLPPSGQLLSWSVHVAASFCAIEASGYSLHSLSNIGVEAAVSKHWGEKWTKPLGFSDYYPLKNPPMI